MILSRISSAGQVVEPGGEWKDGDIMAGMIQKR